MVLAALCCVSCASICSQLEYLLGFVYVTHVTPTKSRIKNALRPLRPRPQSARVPALSVCLPAWLSVCLSGSRTVSGFLHLPAICGRNANGPRGNFTFRVLPSIFICFHRGSRRGSQSGPTREADQEEQEVALQLQSRLSLLCLLWCILLTGRLSIKKIMRSFLLLRRLQVVVKLKVVPPILCTKLPGKRVTEIDAQKERERDRERASVRAAASQTRSC